MKLMQTKMKEQAKEGIDEFYNSNQPEKAPFSFPEGVAKIISEFTGFFQKVFTEKKEEKTEPKSGSDKDKKP